MHSIRLYCQHNAQPRSPHPLLPPFNVFLLYLAFTSSNGLGVVERGSHMARFCKPSPTLCSCCQHRQMLVSSPDIIQSMLLICAGKSCFLYRYEPLKLSSFSDHENKRPLASPLRSCFRSGVRQSAVTGCLCDLRTF